jgi:phosphoglycerate dehydrogenase-like enzyme
VKIVLCYPIDSPQLRQIAETAANCGLSTEIPVEIINAGQERIATEILGADIYCGHAKVPVPWDAVVKQGRLRWIQSSAAGMDHCLVPAVVASKITVSSASGLLANQVTDHTLALTLGFLRSLPVFFRAQAKREFIRRPTRDLHHAKVGIVGFGGNGRRLAKVLREFQCEMFATDCYPVNKPDYVRELLPADRLDEILPKVDILVLAAPLTSETRGMLDERRLRLLKPDALLVNMARGPLVIERDLVKVLNTAHLAGAVMDVTEVEPLSPESELWDLPNVIITPHVGGQVKTRSEDVTNFFCQNLPLFARGERLLNQIDKRLGFPLPADALWRKWPA